MVRVLPRLGAGQRFTQVYALRVESLRGWNRREIGDPILVYLLEMGLWYGTYPDNKYTFNLCHDTTITTVRADLS